MLFFSSTTRELQTTAAGPIDATFGPLHIPQLTFEWSLGGEGGNTLTALEPPLGKWRLLGLVHSLLYLLFSQRHLNPT